VHHLSISLLRSFDVTLDGKPVPEFESDKVRALLAYLAVENDHPHRRETLAGLLWPDRPERNARQNLSQALYNLREVLGERESAVPLLHATHQTLQLIPNENICIDVPEFVHLLELCPGNVLLHAPCQDDGCCLRKAADLYQSDMLPGFSLPDSAPFEEWLLLQRERLHRLALEALQHLVECCEARGNLEGATQHAWRWAELEPWHEGAHRALMRFLALSGECASALAQYETCARILRDELDTEPSPETQQLYEAVRDGTDLTGFSLLSGLVDAPRHNLPARVTSFIGRDGELAALGSLLVEPKTRLVTVVGTGGMGKTRLAIEVGRETLGTAFDEAWLVELAPIPDDAAVPRAVARALGVQEGADRPLPESIALSLRTRNLLLVVDNCEHVVDGAANLVALLLARCPELTVLATSREPLHVAGEHLYDVPPMALLGSDEGTGDLEEADAIQLFIERAAAVRPGFALSEETIPFVADICRRLDGMPLAIELAAARLRALSVHDIARQLDDRFRLLTGGSRTALPRQRTLRNTVEWSYDLLDEAERALFDRLSIFAGGLSLEAAQEVCSAKGVEKRSVLDLLSALVDKSLVSTLRDPEGETRYRLLETLRAYGQERLIERGDVEEMARRHAWYYVAFAERLYPLIYPHEEAMLPAYRRLHVEEQNLDAAMRWSLAHRQPEAALRIGCAVIVFTIWPPEGSQRVLWLRQALAQGQEVDPLVRAIILDHMGFLALYAGDVQRAFAAAREQIKLAQEANSARWVGWGLMRLGRAHRMAGEHVQAHSCLERSLEIAHQQGDRMLAANVENHLASDERPDKRHAMIQELLPRVPQYALPHFQKCLAVSAWDLGQIEDAQVRLEESLAGWVEMEATHHQGVCFLSLAEIAIKRGDFCHAERLLVRGQKLVRQYGLFSAVVQATQRLGGLAWLCCDYETARQCFEESLFQAREHGYTELSIGGQIWLALVACEQDAYDRAKALCAQALDGLPDGDRGVFGFASYALGRVALRQGQAAHAVAHYRESLGCLEHFQHRRTQQFPQDVGHMYADSRPDKVEALEDLAWALAADGQAAEATRLLAVAACEREEMGTILYPVDCPHHEKAMETARSALGEEAFAAAWAEGEALSLDEAVARALGGDGD